MQDKLDFSGLERLSPRADSWDKVCTRLDASNANGAMAEPAGSTPTEHAANLIPFRILSAIPLAASLVLIGISVLMTAFSNSSSEVSINSISSSEVASWYSSLGNDNGDDFDTLDENVTLSYFYKEAR